MKGHFSDMESPLRYNFRDVLRVPASALSAKQILVMTLFLLGGLAIYDLFAYAAFALNGDPLDLVFNTFGFFPFAELHFVAMSARAVYWIGAGAAVLTVMLGFFAVSAFNIEAIRGNRFMTPSEGIRFAFKRLPQIFLAELSIVAFVAVIVGLFALLGLVSRIPYVGEWIYTALLAIPNFIIALFAIFIIFVLSLTVLLLPAVAAAERQGETFTAILETFSTIILQPFRWFGYTIYSIGAAKICGFIYAYFAFRAVQFLTWSAGLGGGSDVGRLVKSGLSHLPIRSDIATQVFNIFPGVPFGVRLYEHVGYPSHEPITQFMAFMLFLIFASILGYTLAIVAAGQARGYVVLRYLKDEYNIASEEPLFFKDEPVNDAVTETETGTGNDIP
jgi:hypothetical protein